LQESAAGAVNSPNNGLVVFENGFDNVTINRTGGGNGGDPVLQNSFAGLGVSASGFGAVVVDLTDPDAGDTPIAISSANVAGIALTSNFRPVTLIMPN